MTGQPVALVTGGGKRVGRAIALRLARAGYDVAITYLNSESAALQVVAEVESIGRRARAIRADLTDPDTAVEQIGQAVETTFGRLDVLVNSASLWAAGSLGQTDLNLLRSVAAIHVQSPLLLCRRFEKLLRAARGCVINITDLLAERPWPEYLAYCTSKGAMNTLTLGLARALAPDVTVNAIAPGVVVWPDQTPEQFKEQYLKRVPLGAAGTPEDVASLVHYLATEGKYITGQILHLDGGRSIT